MRKNGFWTFCFAFIPGAGQMYQGYMKRGLSLVSVCAAAIGVASLFYPLVGFAFGVGCIVWMYSFFDTFNLRSQLLTGDAPADDYLFHLGQDASFTRFFKARHKLFGWALVAVGLYTLYDQLVMDLLARLYWRLENQWVVQVLYNILDKVPTVLICLALIALGVWLVRGPQKKQPFAEDQDEMEAFSEYATREDDPHDGQDE